MTISSSDLGSCEHHERSNKLLPSVARNLAQRPSRGLRRMLGRRHSRRLLRGSTRPAPNVQLIRRSRLASRSRAATSRGRTNSRTLVESLSPRWCRKHYSSTSALDTGALIALERGEKRLHQVLVAAKKSGLVVTVPAVAVIEWWRFAPSQERILGLLSFEPTSEQIAKLAGDALASVWRATPIDAAIMASAALRGDMVYTSDLNDLQRLQTFFPNVRVFRATGT